MFAAGRNRAAVIRFLIQKGADTKITTEVTKLGRALFDEDGNPIPAAGGGRGDGVAAVAHSQADAAEPAVRRVEHPPP